MRRARAPAWTRSAPALFGRGIMRTGRRRDPCGRTSEAENRVNQAGKRGKRPKPPDRVFKLNRGGRPQCNTRPCPCRFDRILHKRQNQILQIDVCNAGNNGRSSWFSSSYTSSPSPTWWRRRLTGRSPSRPRSPAGLDCQSLESTASTLKGSARVLTALGSPSSTRVGAFL